MDWNPAHAAFLRFQCARAGGTWSFDFLLRSQSGPHGIRTSRPPSHSSPRLKCLPFPSPRTSYPSSTISSTPCLQTCLPLHIAITLNIDIYRLGIPQDFLITHHSWTLDCTSEASLLASNPRITTTPGLFFVLLYSLDISTDWNRCHPEDFSALAQLQVLPFYFLYNCLRF